MLKLENVYQIHGLTSGRFTNAFSEPSYNNIFNIKFTIFKNKSFNAVHFHDKRK